MRKIKLLLFYQLAMWKAKRQLAEGKKICEMSEKRIREIKELLRHDAEFTKKEDEKQ